MKREWMMKTLQVQICDCLQEKDALAFRAKLIFVLDAL